MEKVYHLNLSKKDIKDAKIVLLPGDPGRVQKIAYSLDKDAKEIAHKREYRTYIAKVQNENVLVTSTGIGGASTSICIDELAQLGIKNFIRVGTSGAIQKYLRVGDVVITSASVRLDGASEHYAPIEYPAVAHYEILFALRNAAEKLKIRYYVGITASCATFYPGQERYDNYSKYVIKKFQGTKMEWEKLQVLNYEMESATLFTLCSTFGLFGGCVTGIVGGEDRKIKKEALKKGEENAIQVAKEAVKILIKKQDSYL